MSYEFCFSVIKNVIKMDMLKGQIRRCTCGFLWKRFASVSIVLLVVCVVTMLYYSQHMTYVGYQRRTEVAQIGSVTPLVLKEGSNLNYRIPNLIGRVYVANPNFFQNYSLDLRGKDIWNVVSLIMDEWNPEVYNKERSNNSLQAADLSNSKIIISNFKEQYEMNENIHLRIKLYDGYRRPKRHGGDLIWVRMYENWKDSGAAEACHVTDYENGSYGALCKALWTGRPIISVQIRYYREVVLAIANVFNQLRALRYLNATFSTGSDVQEITICLAEPLIPGYKELCNLTSQNFGLSWYCGAPRNKKISCNDWKTTSGKYLPPVLIYSPVERRLLTRTITDEPYKLEINVRDRTLSSRRRPSCWNYPRVNLWDQQSPTGYFYNRKWSPSHCDMERTQSELKRCLQGREIYIFGDSTVRQWYDGFKRVMDCKLHKKLWKSTKFAEPNDLFCLSNFTVKWRPHAKPIFMGGIPSVRYGKPIWSYIDNIPQNSNTVLLIHMYLHLILNHPVVFIDRMVRIRKSVEKFLDFSPNGVVLIKGPHSCGTYDSIDGDAHYMDDYFINLHKTILRHIFKGVLDKVVFLDFADMTMSVDSRDIHPAQYIVEEMVKYMLSFVCKSSPADV